MGKYVFTFVTVCVDVSGATVRTMLIIFSIFCGSVIRLPAKCFDVPDSLETMPCSCPLPKIYFAAKKYKNI